MQERFENRSNWGEDDQKGAMNLVTPELTLAALGTVSQGRMVDLSHEIKVGHPRLDPFIGPFQMGMWANADTTRRMAREHFNAKNDPGVFTERVELCMHTGTHVDALGHFTIGEEMFNGWNYRLSTNNWGLERLGIEQMPPVIARGVLFDVAGEAGEEFLEGGRVVTKDDLKKAADKAKFEIRPGDIALIRTGWGRFFMADNDRYTESEPGIDEEAARWLTERKVCAIGTDSMAVEVLPNPDPQSLFPVHQHALVEAGVHLIENLAFDQIMKEEARTFCFILLPVKFTGATACPVRPVALL
jgi:kynurenine formamidase